MASIDFKLLASQWIAAQKESDDQALQRDPGNHPAIDAVINLTSEPEMLWSFVLEVLSDSEANDFLGKIGAGPLEDLIAYSGDTFLERINHELKRNKNLEIAMKGVWISEDVMPSVEAYASLGCVFVSAEDNEELKWKCSCTTPRHLTRGST